MKLEWLEELSDEEIKKVLDRDTKLVYEYCSMTTLKDLLSNLHSIRLYISKRPVERAQKLYIAKYFTGDNHKELAARLDCSDQFVYDTLEEIKQKRKAGIKEPDLFAIQKGS